MSDFGSTEDLNLFQIWKAEMFKETSVNRDANYVESIIYIKISHQLNFVFSRYFPRESTT